MHSKLRCLARSGRDYGAFRHSSSTSMTGKRRYVKKTRGPTRNAREASRRVNRSPAGSQRKHEPKAGGDSLHRGGTESGGAFRQEAFVERDYLRDVCDRILFQPGFAAFQEDVSGRIGQSRIRGDRDGDHGANPAPVEAVGLYDEDRAAIARLGSGGARKIGPPDFSATHHQSSSGSEWLCIRTRAISSSEDTAESE